MKRIPATRKELKLSFRHHYFIYKKLNGDTTLNPRTKRLILFYSVESGLKCFLLNKIQKNTTNDLEKHPDYSYLEKHGHDIRNLIKSVNLGDEANYQLKSFVLQRYGKIEPDQLHQIWRYGIETKDLDYENKSEKVLQNIANWLESHI